MGSKISVAVILIAMIILAGLVTDIGRVPEGTETKVPEEQQTYEETELQKTAPKAFLFENYPTVFERYTEAAAEVDFTTNPLAKNYEEIIGNGVQNIGVNYGAVYSIVTWSCGDACQNSAIIDVRDGTIHTYGIISAYGLAFSPDSTLLIINPRENVPAENEEKMIETDYYEITETGLTFLGKQFEDNEPVEDCIQAIANARNRITNEVLEFSTPCKVPFGWEIVP